MLLPEQKPTCTFIVMVRFCALRRRRVGTVHVTQLSGVDWRDPVSPISVQFVCGDSNVYVVCPSEQKVSRANGLQAVGWPKSTDEGVKSERYKHWREVENGEESSFLSHAGQT